MHGDFPPKSGGVGGLIGSLYPSTAGTDRGHAAGARVKRRVPKIGTEQNATAPPRLRRCEILHKIKLAQRTRVPRHLGRPYAVLSPTSAIGAQTCRFSRDQ